MLVLGSTSPRRAMLLRQLGLEFEIRAPDVDESVLPEEYPADYVSRMSNEKYAAVMAGNGSLRNQVLLTADTIVVLDQQILGKPRNEAEGQLMLDLLSGATHKVVTSVTIGANLGETQQFLVETNVEFRTLTSNEISAYWSTGEPQDKAGGYGIQGLGAVFIRRIEGSYTNVVGLPLTETAEVLADFGISIFS